MPSLTSSSASSWSSSSSAPSRSLAPPRCSSGGLNFLERVLEHRVGAILLVERDSLDGAHLRSLGLGADLRRCPPPGLRARRRLELLGIVHRVEQLAPERHGAGDGEDAACGSDGTGASPPFSVRARERPPSRSLDVALDLAIAFAAFRVDVRAPREDRRGRGREHFGEPRQLLAQPVRRCDDARCLLVGAGRAVGGRGTASDLQHRGAEHDAGTEKGSVLLRRVERVERGGSTTAPRRASPHTPPSPRTTATRTGASATSCARTTRRRSVLSTNAARRGSNVGPARAPVRRRKSARAPRKTAKLPLETDRGTRASSCASPSLAAPSASASESESGDVTERLRDRRIVRQRVHHGDLARAARFDPRRMSLPAPTRSRVDGSSASPSSSSLRSFAPSAARRRAASRRSRTHRRRSRTRPPGG